MCYKKLFALLFIVLFLVIGCSKTNNLINNIPESAPGTTWANLNPQFLAEKREKMLEVLSRTYKIKNPPKVDLVRYVSENESLSTEFKCLIRFNIPAKQTFQGVEFNTEPPNPSLKQVQLALYKCNAMYPQDPRTDGNVSYYPRIKAEELYNYYKTTQTPCLKKLGYTNIENAPSLQKWLEDYYYDKVWWSPFEEVKSNYLLNNQGAYETKAPEVLKKCPKYPKNFFPSLPNN